MSRGRGLYSQFYHTPAGISLSLLSPFPFPFLDLADSHAAFGQGHVMCKYTVALEILRMTYLLQRLPSAVVLTPPRPLLPALLLNTMLNRLSAKNHPSH